MFHAKGYVIIVVYLLGLALFSIGIECVHGRHSSGSTNAKVFDVTNYDAAGDGVTDDSMAFIKAWNGACHSTEPSKVLIPDGKFSTGEVIFAGPCSAKAITIEIQGTVLGDPDLSLYSMGAWITIEHVDGVIVTGGGVLNGQGNSVWEYATGGSGAGEALPVSLLFQHSSNSVVQGINFVNSKGFHIKVYECTNLKISDVHITAPPSSPNTVGIHISNSKNTMVSNNVIQTGGDCIVEGDGNTNLAVSKNSCRAGKPVHST